MGLGLGLCQPLAGLLADRVGHHRTNLAGLLGGALVWACMPFLGAGVLPRAIALTLWAAFTAMSTTSRFGLVSLLVPSSRHGTYMGAATSAWAAGAGLGALASATLYDTWGYDSISRSIVLALIASAIAVAIAVPPPGDEPPARRPVGLP